MDRARKHLEEIGKNYNLITDNRSFQHYLNRRKKYIKIFCEKNAKRDVTIADLAAGTGSYSEILKGYGYLLNLDLSFNALMASEASTDGIRRINADVLNIPLKNESADIIFLVGILHHVPHRLEEIFNEVARVVKNGGSIFIDEPNGFNFLWFIYMKLSKIDRVGAVPLFPFLLKKMARKYSLTIENELFWGFVPPWPNNKKIVDLFSKIEPVVESSFLSWFCARYVLCLKK